MGREGGYQLSGGGGGLSAKWRGGYQLSGGFRRVFPLNRYDQGENLFISHSYILFSLGFSSHLIFGQV